MTTADRDVCLLLKVVEIRELTSQNRHFAQPLPSLPYAAPSAACCHYVCASHPLSTRASCFSAFCSWPCWARTNGGSLLTCLGESFGLFKEAWARKKYRGRRHKNHHDRGKRTLKTRLLSWLFKLSESFFWTDASPVKRKARWSSWSSWSSWSGVSFYNRR